MRVAIVENTRVTHHGQVGVALHEAAALIDIFQPWSDGRLPDVSDGYDALVVFGGEQSARDDETHPYLPALARTMRAFTGTGQAVLGICLGSQLLARGFEAANILGGSREFGWQEVSLLEEASRDAVFSGLPERFPIFQWHTDTFALPLGAVQLATGGVPHQAFRIGRATYGTQFHFEANRAVVADWTRTFPEATERMHPGWTSDHPGTADRFGPEADAVGLTIARAWVALI